MPAIDLHYLFINLPAKAKCWIRWNGECFLLNMLNACTEEKKIEFYARRVSRNDRAHAKINAFLRFVEFRTQNIAPNCKEHINYKLLFFFFWGKQQIQKFQSCLIPNERKEFACDRNKNTFHLMSYCSMCLHRFAFSCVWFSFFWNLYLWIYLRVRKKPFAKSLKSIQSIGMNESRLYAALFQFEIIIMWNEHKSVEFTTDTQAIHFHSRWMLIFVP